MALSCLRRSLAFTLIRARSIQVRSIQDLHAETQTLTNEQQASSSSRVALGNVRDWPARLLTSFREDCLVFGDFISAAEEDALLADVHTRLKRLRYEDSHWDDAIHLYRETEKSRWTDENAAVLDRVRRRAFPADAAHLTHVHVLDLHKDGHIKPHIDSVRYCGNVIAGLSLLSDAVMRLVHQDEPSISADLLLQRRSLYVLRGVARYEFKHEVLDKAESSFEGQPIVRDRRISIMCRSLPFQADPNS